MKNFVLIKIVLFLMLYLTGIAESMDGEESLNDFHSTNKGTLFECECWKWPECVSNCSSNQLLEVLFSSEHTFLAGLPTPFIVVFPLQFRKNKYRYDISTITKRGNYYHSTSFFLRLFERKIVQLKLEKSKLIGPSNQFGSLSFRMRSGKFTEVESDVTKIHLCQYTGSVKIERQIAGSSQYFNSINSFAAVDTCRGIKGIFSLENGTYEIQPLNCPQCKDGWPHIIHAANMQPIDRKVRLRTFWRLSDFSPVDGTFYPDHFRISPQDVFRVRLGVIMDYKMFKACGSNKDTALQYATKVVNLATMAFQNTQVKLNLVHVEVWNLRDLANISSHIKDTLNNLVAYRLTSWRAHRQDDYAMPASGAVDSSSSTNARSSAHRQLREAMLPHEATARSPMDASILLTGELFVENTEYLTPPDSTCTPRATGVIQVTNVKDIFHVSRLIYITLMEQLGIKSLPCPDLYPCDSLAADKSRLRLALLSGISGCLLANKRGLTPDQFPLDKCGDGKVDRGEECDRGRLFGSSGSRMRSDCCNPETCLATTWAQCVGGPCCNNCSLIPSGKVCRPAKDECDLPEFCSGDKGSCPHDRYLENGQPCREGSALCYQGRCPARSSQCQSVWGRQSHSASKECYLNYNLNSKNSCGLGKCRRADVLCGVLHCEGGEKKPISGVIDSKHFVNYIVRKERQIECKSLGDSPDRYVREGTQCAPNHYCFNHRCTSPEQSIISECPTALNKKTSSKKICSAQGVCMNDRKCMCYPDWTGAACELPANETDPFVGLIWRYMRELSSQQKIDPDEFDNMEDNDNDAKKSSRITTGFLIIILGSVIGCVFLVMTLFMVCYRRRTTSNSKKSLDVTSAMLNLSRKCSQETFTNCSQKKFLIANSGSGAENCFSHYANTEGANGMVLDCGATSGMGISMGCANGAVKFSSLSSFRDENSSMNCDDDSDVDSDSSEEEVEILEKLDAAITASQRTLQVDLSQTIPQAGMDLSWRPQPDKSILKKCASSSEMAQQLYSSPDAVHDVISSSMHQNLLQTTSSSQSSISSGGSSSLLSDASPAPPIVLCNASNQTDHLHDSAHILDIPPAPQEPLPPLPETPTSGLHHNHLIVNHNDDCDECRAAAEKMMTSSTDQSHYYQSLESSHYHSATLALGGSRPANIIKEPLFNGGSPTRKINNTVSNVAYHPVNYPYGKDTAQSAVPNNVSSPLLAMRNNRHADSLEAQFQPSHEDYYSSTQENAVNNPKFQLQQRRTPVVTTSIAPPLLQKSIHHPLSKKVSTSAASSLTPQSVSALNFSQSAGALQHVPSPAFLPPHQSRDDLLSEVSISAYRRVSSGIYADSSICPSEGVGSNEGTCDDSDTNSLPDMCADLVHLANLGHSGRPNPLLTEEIGRQNFQSPALRQNNFDRSIDNRESPELPPPPSDTSVLYTNPNSKHIRS